MRHPSRCSIISAAFTVAILFAASTATAITLEPILHFSFDTATGEHGSTIVDESVTGYDGVVNVGLTPVSGQFGNALEFGGGAYVGLWNPVLSTRDAYQPYTLSCWVKTTATGGFITQYNTTGDDYALRFGTGIWTDGTGKPKWWQNSNDLAFSNVAVDDGTWHHMVYVKDANQNLSIFVDGVDQTDPGYTNQHTSPFMNARMRIGTFVSGTLNYTGTIDEVQIYNTALTPAQIVELRDQNEVTVTSGPSVLQVDFGKYMQGIQPGWQDFSKLDAGPASKDFSFGTSGVTISLSDTGTGPHWQDRAGVDGMTIDSIQHPIGRVAMDFVFGTGYENFDVTLSGLDPGTYYARTYHHDPRTDYGTVGVGVTDANGARTVATTPITYGALNSPADNIASPGNIGTVPMKITVDGSGQAVINLLPTTQYTHLSGLEMTADLPADLKVDFQVAGGDTQAGYQAYEQPTQDNAIRPQAHWFFTEMGRQGSARLELRGNDSDSFSPRNRGDAVHAMGDLIEDFFAPSISSTITLSNLKAGQYQVTTYHHDMNVQHDALDVSVTDSDGAGRSVVTGLAQTTGSTPTSPASATFAISTSGILPVEIDYSSDSAIIHNSVEVEKIGTGTEPKTLKVYLLGGQSNADGRGTSSALPSEWQELQSDVPTFHGGAWQEMQPGLTKMSPDMFGPELSFGKAMSEGEDEFVAVIKYANGGTDLANEWRPGSGGGDPGGTEWQAFAAAIEDASLAFGEDLAPEFAGMIWMQGEQDSTDYSMAQAYEANLTNFINSVRDLVDTPDMPFVIGRILDYPGYAYADTVRQAQADVAAAMDGVSIIDTDDLDVILGNPNHYNNDGLIELGQRFADALLGSAPTTPGDANRDGYVDVSDLGILATNYGATSGKSWEEGDFTGDGAVDVSDLGILATNYGAEPGALSVPEPGTLALILAASGMLLMVRVSRRR